MSRLKLTSPGVLLILAVALAGGIIVLDMLYLQPYVETQKTSALRERAALAQTALHQAISAEEERLAVAAISLSDRPELKRGALPVNIAPRLARLDGRAAWLAGPDGTLRALWMDGNLPGQGDPQITLPQLPGARPASGLMTVDGGTWLYAATPVEGSGGDSLWLARPLDSELQKQFGRVIGGEVTIVRAAALPDSVVADAAAGRASWPVGESKLAVSWLAHDSAGRTLGYFRAVVPVGQIHAQSVAARRIVLIVLSLSVGLVLLVIVGMHMLVTGPVVRLLRRLQDVDTGESNAENLTRDLHGEPLVIARRLESAFTRLAHISKTDELTGLANRRHFEQVLECFYHQSRRYNRALSVIVMDVDFFKAVNDTAGHHVGDELLKYVSTQIEAASRRADLPARLGGDEFAVLLPETTASDAECVAERIREAVCNHEVKLSSLEMNVTLSMGIADLNAGEIDSPDAMVSLADKALYAAKELGRNRAVMAHDLSGTHLLSEEGGGKVDTLCKKLAGLNGQFKDVFLQAVQEVVMAFELRDPNMADHARKVQRYAVLLAEEMGLAERVVKRIEVAAMLHDIGMLALPDAVMMKPGELNPVDLANIRRHPLLGVRMMERMEFLEQEIPAVRYHHERYDGKGYPEGISGAAIPLTARILAVAEAFDALTSRRAHRDALDAAEALQELRKGAGNQFDPNCVDAFCAMAERLGDELISTPTSRWRHTHLESAASAEEN